MKKINWTILYNIKLENKNKIRNKKDNIFDKTNKLVLDNLYHFPIFNIIDAKNAIVRVNNYDIKPKWFSGTLDELKNIVIEEVHKKYPTIEL